jgi:hypothetical protein
MRRLLCGKESIVIGATRSLRRLVLGDTLLLTKTGFGKSIIFHAYSNLDGKDYDPVSSIVQAGGGRTSPVWIHDPKYGNTVRSRSTRATMGELTEVLQLVNPYVDIYKTARKQLVDPSTQPRGWIWHGRLRSWDNDCLDLTVRSMFSIYAIGIC